jgi:hypothetical protein
VTRAGQLSDRVAINALGASSEQCGNHDRAAKTNARDDVRDLRLASRAAGPGCKHGNKGYQPELV